MTITRRDSFNLTTRQLEVLKFLAARENWSIGEVASALGVSSAAATKAITRLERKGLVSRSENMMDRRCVNVSLTSSGTDTLRKDKQSVAY